MYCNGDSRIQNSYSSISKLSLGLWHNQMCYPMNKLYQKWRIYPTVATSGCLIGDMQICVEEIKSALEILKLGKSAGPDGLSPEHIVYGGYVLKIWLKKIFNRTFTLEEVPGCMKEGLVIPIYKRQGKDPLLINSYREITLSSVLSKVFDIILLQ